MSGGNASIWNNVQVINGLYKTTAEAWKLLQGIGFEYVKFPGPETRLKKEKAKKPFSCECSCSKGDTRLKLEYIHDSRLGLWTVVHRQVQAEDLCRCYESIPKAPEGVRFLYDKKDALLLGYTDVLACEEKTPEAKLKAIKRLMFQFGSNESELKSRGVQLPEHFFMDVDTD